MKLSDPALIITADINLLTSQSHCTPGWSQTSVSTTITLHHPYRILLMKIFWWIIMGRSQGTDLWMFGPLLNSAQLFWCDTIWWTLDVLSTSHLARVSMTAFSNRSHQSRTMRPRNAWINKVWPFRSGYLCSSATHLWFFRSTFVISYEKNILSQSTVHC